MIGATYRDEYRQAAGAITQALTRCARAGIFGTVVGSTSCDQVAYLVAPVAPDTPSPEPPSGATLTRLFGLLFLLNPYVVA
jgi:hypothetical protein